MWSIKISLFYLKPCRQHTGDIDTLCLQMIEPELAFADLKDDMACATAYLQYVVRQSMPRLKVWWIQYNLVHNGMELQLLDTHFIQDSSMLMLSCKCISLHMRQVGALGGIGEYVHGHVISSEVLRSRLIDLQVRYILENCKEDMEFFNQWVEKGIITRLTVCPIKRHLNYYMSV